MIENFLVNFFIFTLTYFIPASDFFTTLPHSYSLYHGAVVLFFSYLLLELEIFFRIKATLVVGTPTADLKVLPIHLKNF